MSFSNVLRAFLVLSVLMTSTVAFVSNSFPSSNALQFSSSSLQMVADGRTPFIAGNWKMNPTSIDEATELATKVKDLTAGNTETEIAIFTPHPFLYPSYNILKDSKVQIGAQTIFFEDKGAYTGAVSASMIKSIGAEYVLTGHSERRVLFKTDDTSINRKVHKILDSGLKCILCIGEDQSEYNEGLNTEICTVQLAKDLAGVTAEQMKDVVIAYEPVWAIGTGLTCPPDIAQSVHASIRAWIEKKYGADVAKATRIQYGGSVTPETVDELMSCPDIDGALVGGASLVPESFARICNFEKL
mmetsp:Transcript_18379/g.24257  ORF Transcript_18379/g.24257 Transcript_18379/m.24257 type:complete len:300 (+) Transcript_18379:71-970(+)|eukprot:CAMPEP_0117760700 /NCGR_PEP_ID=MMETSP0947-20121206/16799_1 /TAXON_ID=44440 /ORGANISM="Chattonella subsalsa, Strain CCMP2191" /LENGTH=299 /DNA_ID=CAMNT_0005581467 /DNA_START=60 /DNA_END=959 /DNA_ORIENTATION=-